MGKRQRVKKFLTEKVIPNRTEIITRVIRVYAVYRLTGPLGAFAFNSTELGEAYAALGQSCLGDRLFGMVPVPKSYLEGTLCLAMLLACGAAAAQGFGNPTNDAACAALIRTLTERRSAS